ncbi:MAG: cobalamin-dependent protein [Deferrisomatales bacterium]|nr:cobalamin-dependent protein [Deferrisomatales bacterium]
MGDDRTDLIGLLRTLDENGVLERVRQRLTAGEDPLQIMAECQEGVHQVGLLYEERQYFVSGLIMAGEILRQVVELVEPALERRPSSGPAPGTILLGTVEGDIHDIGKNVMHMLLRCNGFTVIDLGVDVAPEVFVARALELRPAVVGLSGLLTIAFDAMRDTVALLHAEWEGARPVPATLIGGGMVDEKVWRHVGSEYWAPDPTRGLELCRRLTLT